jgi:hypothetical integral membrane protein (TIGR02206 family)
MAVLVTPTGFRLFGPAHLLILASVPLLAAALSWAGRRSPTLATAIRIGLGALLALDELAVYAYLFEQNASRLRYAMPLQLCDLAVWLSVASAFTLNPGVYDIAWFTGIAGSGMALLTPDLWAPFNSWPTASFFLSHGLTLVILLMLLWSGAARPRARSFWRAWLVSNLFAGLVGIFDALFDANYMYLRQKPASASLLDYFGPWPLYLITGEAVALGLYWLLYLPFRRDVKLS